MYNYFMLIGTVCKEIEVKEVGDGKRVVSLNLACSKPYQNTDGSRGTDFFIIQCWEFLADTANETLGVGSRIAIKGRIYPKLITLETGAKITHNELIGERIFNLSRKNEFTDISDPALEEKESN